jgi:hypothetical protein
LVLKDSMSRDGDIPIKQDWPHLWGHFLLEMEWTTKIGLRSIVRNSRNAPLRKGWKSEPYGNELGMS